MPPTHGHSVRTAKHAGKKAPRETTVVFVGCPREDFDVKLRKSWESDMVHWGVHGGDGTGQPAPDPSALARMYERLSSTDAEGFVTGGGGVSSTTDAEELNQLRDEVRRLSKLIQKPGAKPFGPAKSRTPYAYTAFAPPMRGVPAPKSSTRGASRDPIDALSRVLMARMGKPVRAGPAPSAHSARVVATSWAPQPRRPSPCPPSPW